VEKAIKNGQVCVVEMNESEPSMKHRNGNLMLSKPSSERKFGISLDVNWITDKTAAGVEWA